ncbi:MAG: alpha/beta fold hydrolase [Candidatus Lustribacter sp.]
MERCTVLLHGLTNCPQQFEEYARLLHARGENVYVPRLPYHGHADRITRAIGNLTVTDIQVAAADAAHIGGGLGRQVSVAGISLGATMALWLAQTGGVDRAVGVAPFLMVPLLPRRLGLAVMSVLATLPNRFLWWNPRRREQQPPDYGYPGFWTRCLAQCSLAGAMLFAAARNAAPVAARCTLVLNAHDPAVNNGVARQLARRWRGRPGYELCVWDDLGRRHDVVDPTTFPGARTLVYPRLTALLTSEP